MGEQSMNRYEVSETMVYEVWATSEDEAVDIIANDADRDARGPACTDRHAVLDLTAEDAATLGLDPQWRDRADASPLVREIKS
jgi:hypothetical protein